jgi:hypothetical protein
MAVACDYSKNYCSNPEVLPSYLFIRVIRILRKKMTINLFNKLIWFICHKKYHWKHLFNTNLLPPYQIIGQLYILRQTLKINFSQEIWDIWHNNYTIGKLFWIWIQWYNFYIIYLIFSLLKLKVKGCLEVCSCPIIRYGGSIYCLDISC